MQHTQERIMGLELNIAICDDEKYYRNYVENFVREYLVKENVLFHIELFEDGTDFFKADENIQKFDIIFLDIEMKDMNGMETAYSIRKKNSEMDIVFITVMPDYVFEGYKVSAVRYIMKKEIEKSLPECLANILKKRKCSGHKMEFPFVGGKRTVLLNDILYIESKSHKLQFTRKGGILYMYGQINDLESKMTDYNFVRCHQSFLVNLEHIEQINNYLICLSDGSEIPVSRPRYPKVKQLFLQYKEI